MKMFWNSIGCVTKETAPAAELAHIVSHQLLLLGDIAARLSLEPGQLGILARHHQMAVPALTSRGADKAT
jgi:hypothetical protein